jgi:hypothetical protein
LNAFLPPEVVTAIPPIAINLYRQAKRKPAQETRRAIGLLWVHDHAGAEAGLDRGGRVLVWLLRTYSRSFQEFWP